MASNTTCDILHYGTVPPPPDVLGVAIALDEDFTAGHGETVNSSSLNRWTHYALFPKATDLRDGYAPGAIGQDGTALTCDTIYVPSFAAADAVVYYVIFVARLNAGTTSECLIAYLQRTAPAAWGPLATTTAGL